MKASWNKLGEILLNMFQGAPNCQNMLQKKVLNNICSGPTFWHNVTRIPLKFTNTLGQYVSLFTYSSRPLYIHTQG